MKEYIEREAVVAFLENMAASNYLIQCFKSKERFTAADVVPIVHGEWKLYPSDAYMKCSVCGMEYLKSKMPQVVGYCPNCGACMDGGK